MMRVEEQFTPEHVFSHIREGGLQKPGHVQTGFRKDLPYTARPVAAAEKIGASVLSDQGKGQETL
jgi:hypothetical protein